MHTETAHAIIIAAVALIHLTGLAAAGHAALTARTPQGAIAWAVSLIFMPYLALLPYLIFGRTKFEGYVAARRLRNRRLHELTRALRQNSNARSEAEAMLGHTLAGIQTLTALTGMPFSRGNNVQLLVDGDATFDAILSTIAAAKYYVMVQFFIVHDDGIGRRLKQALLSKAKQGLKVYFLYDGIGCYDLPDSYLEELGAAGVKVQEFITRRRRLINRYQLNFRNHRKIVVVDGEQAFVGGLNAGDEYLGLKPPLSPWRDTHVQVSGLAVAAIQLTFVEDWYWATGHLPELRWQPPVQRRNMHCQVVPSGPADERETCKYFFVQVINSAQSRLWITTPYFVPDEAVFAALKLAVLRGVDVRILIPARADHNLVFKASSLYAYEAVCAGIKMFRYQPGFIHQKVILINDDAASVGSANMDNRSLRLNFEITVLTVDKGFAASVESMLLEDFARALPVTRQEYEKASAMRRLYMNVARLFAPVL
ncbi:MAG: cardiolipin synthase [Gammaproteobacteria bacterium]|nr:cardiolipin synthase [Gammaproteobacteria bacterium]